MIGISENISIFLLFHQQMLIIKVSLFEAEGITKRVDEQTVRLMWPSTFQNFDPLCSRELLTSILQVESKIRLAFKRFWPYEIHLSEIENAISL